MIKFKSENGLEYKARLDIEFNETIDKRLKAILLGVASAVERRFGLDITITCLNRTAKENRECNGSPSSSHLDFRGADLRNRDLP